MEQSSIPWEMGKRKRIFAYIVAGEVVDVGL